MCQFGPVKLPWGPRRGHSIKFLPPPPPSPVVGDRKNYFLTIRMQWNDLKVCMKKCFCFPCHFEVSILTPFGIFCHFRSLYTYTLCYGYNRFDWLTLILRLNWTCRIKRIFHGVMMRIEKVEPEGRPVRSWPSFSEVQIPGFPEGSTFPILTNDPMIDYFSCLITFIDHLMPWLNNFYMFT